MTSNETRGVVRETIVAALRRFGGIAVLARKPDSIGFIAEIAAREVAILASAPAPASGGVEGRADARPLH